MDVELVSLEPRPAVAVRVNVPFDGLDMGALFGPMLGRVFGYLGEHGMPPAGPPYARYQEFGPERADVEIGIPVAGAPADLRPLEADDQLGVTELPGGEAASYLHVGRYPDLGLAYGAVEAWLAAHGRARGGAPWESYVVGPERVGGDESKLETLLVQPLA